MFSNKWNKAIDFMKKNDQLKKSIGHLGISFNIKSNTPEEILEDNIQISEKFYTLERKLKTKEEDNIFISSAPLSTKNHINLLKIIEKQFVIK